jgi:hypothetical protein
MRTETTQVGNGRTDVRWRRERLVEVGFPPAVAAPLPADARYDTHALIGLVVTASALHRPTFAFTLRHPKGHLT